MGNNDSDKRTLALVMLGIVAILAIVGLVLLFRNSLTGQTARAGYVDYATGLGPLGPEEAASRRIGEPSPSVLRKERLEEGYENSGANKRTLS